MHQSTHKIDSGNPKLPSQVIFDRFAEQVEVLRKMHKVIEESHQVEGSDASFVNKLIEIFEEYRNCAFKRNPRLQNLMESAQSLGFGAEAESPEYKFLIHLSSQLEFLKKRAADVKAWVEKGIPNLVSEISGKEVLEDSLEVEVKVRPFYISLTGDSELLRIQEESSAHCSWEHPVLAFDPKKIAERCFEIEEVLSHEQIHNYTMANDEVRHRDSIKDFGINLSVLVDLYVAAQDTKERNFYFRHIRRTTAEFFLAAIRHEIIADYPLLVSITAGSSNIKSAHKHFTTAGIMFHEAQELLKEQAKKVNAYDPVFIHLAKLASTIYLANLKLGRELIHAIRLARKFGEEALKDVFYLHVVLKPKQFYLLSRFIEHKYGKPLKSQEPEMLLASDNSLRDLIYF
ncbi:MAG: hypothetical protein R3A13_12680 [Bdellovibrionota bacterium]